MSEPSASESRPEPHALTPFLPLLKLLLSAGAITTAVVVYGFFSEAAMLQFNGLPQLTAEFSELLEMGGRALIDSVSTLNGMRLLLLALLLLSLLGLASLRDHRIVGRWLRWPFALMTVQALTVAVVVLVLIGLINANRLGRPQSAAEFREQVESIQRKYLQQEKYDPVVLGRMIERATYDVWPRGTPWHCGDRSDWMCSLESSLPGPGNGATFEVAAREAYAEEFEGAALPGHPIRRTAHARKGARDTFGWLFLWVVAAIPMVAALCSWRRWLSRADVTPLRWGELQRPAAQELEAIERQVHQESRRQPWQGFLLASSHLTEALLVLLVSLSLALLPSAYGVLARTTVGHQEVVVTLKPQIEFKAGAGEWKLADCAPEPVPGSPRWLTDDTGRGAAEATSTGGAESAMASGFTWTCDQATLDGVDAAIRDYRIAWQGLTHARPFDQAAYEKALGQYRPALDRMLKQVADAQCVAAYERAHLQAPTIDEGIRRPDIAELFWQRWSELLDRHAPVRFGYLLNYPRGGSSERITIFRPRRHDLADHRLEARFEEIPRRCIASLTPLPDLRRRMIDDAVTAVLSQPFSKRLMDLTLYPGPHALERSAALYRGRFLPEQLQGALVTTMGTLAHAIEDWQPAKKDAIDLLIAEIDRAVEASPAVADLESRSASQAARERLAGAAATSLHLAASPYAAMQLADRLLPGKPLRAAVDRGEFQELISTAGLAANDLVRTLRAQPPRGCEHHVVGDAPSRDCDFRPIRALHVLLSFVQERAMAAPSVDQRMAACTSLGAMATAAAADAVARITLESVRKPEAIDWIALSPCLVQMPSQLRDSERKLLVELARGQCPFGSRCEGVPEESRVIALGELVEASIYHDEELAIEMLLDPSSAVARSMANSLDEVSPARLAPRLLACAKQENEENAGRCLLGLQLLDDDYSGDEGPARALGDLVRDGLAQAHQSLACSALAGWAGKGLIPRRQFETLAECSDAEPLSRELAMLLIGAADSPSSPSRIPEDTPRDSDSALAKARGALKAEDWKSLEAMIPGMVLNGEETRPLLRELVASEPAPSDLRLAAFEGLMMVDAAAHADLAISQFTSERSALALVAAAAQFLENRPFAEASASLLACARDPERVPMLRLRCVHGLPLLEEGVSGDEGFANALLDLKELAPPEVAAAWVLALAAAQTEFLARGARFEPNVELAAQTPLAAETSDVLRWLTHLRRLIAHLREEASALPAGEERKQLVAALEGFDASTVEKIELFRDLGERP